MGDLANMTDCNGRVSGDRLLRWLRSRAQMEHGWALEAQARGERSVKIGHMMRVTMLDEMADDLEAELTPPDYPDDDGAELPSDDRDTGPCEHCGRMADRVPVRDNGRVFLGCPGCAARAAGDGVDLDDPALKGGPEEV